MILSIAGSDPGGGAGLQLDLKVFTALGADGAAIPALLTVQGARGLERVEIVAADLVEAQLLSLLTNRPVAAVKTGALGSAANVQAVARALAPYPELPVVCDPVCLASRTAQNGLRLLEEGGVDALKEDLLPRINLLTPNLAEAAALTGLMVEDEEGMLAAAQELMQLGAKAVLLKGGHFQVGSPTSRDLLLQEDADPIWLSGRRIPGAESVHGTGCALSSAVAVFLGRGLSMEAAARRGKETVHHWLAGSKAGRLLPSA